MASTPESDGGPEESTADRDAMSGDKAESETTEEPKPFDWMQDTPEWGTKAVPGKKGLTLDDIAINSYGEIPERSEEMTRMPRGAFHVAGVPRLEFYPLSKKVDIWADNAAGLYEEAIQRRWMAHLDVPWDTIEPLSRELELAMCQL